jgi:hypothetical protein
MWLLKAPPQGTSSSTDIGVKEYIKESASSRPAATLEPFQDIAAPT